MRQFVHAGLATTSTLTPSLAHLASALPCSAMIGTFLAIRSRRSMPLGEGRGREKQNSARFCLLPFAVPGQGRETPTFNAALKPFKSEVRRRVKECGAVTKESGGRLSTVGYAQWGWECSLRHRVQTDQSHPGLRHASTPLPAVAGSLRGAPPRPPLQMPPRGRTWSPLLSPEKVV